MKMFWMCRCEREDENQTSPKIAKLSLAHRKSEPKKKIEPEEEEKKRNLETIPHLELEILEKVFSPRGKVNSLSHRRVGKEKRISSQRVKSLTPRDILFSELLVLKLKKLKLMRHTPTSLVFFQKMNSLRKACLISPLTILIFCVTLTGMEFNLKLSFKIISPSCIACYL
jgi:hypothetical protein